MTYADIWTMEHDADLQARVTACAAQELAVISKPVDPVVWTNAHFWQLVVTPGWPEAYSYAVATNVVRPGWNSGVITDAMILDAVQPMVRARG